MTPTDFDLFIKETANKFDYAFLSLTFAALALSFQFSPGMGFRGACLLVLSWFFLIASGLIGGWRLVQKVMYMQLNLSHVKLSAFVRGRQAEFLDPIFLASVQDGHFFDEDSGKPVEEVEMRQKLEHERSRMNEVWQGLQRVEPKIPRYFMWQAIAFAAGMILNGAFAAMNILAKAYGW